jgi:hypothetical protein
MSQHIEICINKITPVQVGYFGAKNKITVRGRFNLIPNMSHIRDYGFKSLVISVRTVSIKAWALCAAAQGPPYISEIQMQIFL